MHYCMGKLVNITLLNDKDGNCSYCGMKGSANKGCCEKKQKLLQVDKDQKNTQFNLLIRGILAMTLHVSFSKICSVEVPAIAKANPISRAYLRNYSLAAYIRNCVFLI